MCEFLLRSPRTVYSVLRSKTELKRLPQKVILHADNEELGLSTNQTERSRNCY